MARLFGTAHHRFVFILVIFFAAVATPALAAPAITYFEGGSPAHAQPGATVVIFAEGLVDPVRVFFSDGVNPVVESTDVAADLDRGLITARVPAGAQTGDMKLSANGVDSSPFLFRIDAGTFVQGTRTVSGQVTDGTNPVAGAAIVMMAFSGCDDETFWDFDVSDGSGNYSLSGADGDYGVFVFPPASAGLAVSGTEVTLGPTPVTANVTLDAGTEVSGRVVLSVLPSVGVPNARVDFETDEGGFDTMLADSNGYYTVRLNPADYEFWVEPGAGALLSFTQTDVTVGATSPQTLSDVALDGGVEISGVVRRQSDLSPLSNVEVGIQLQYSCCSNADETVSGGDGSFSLIVPPNQTYQLQVWVDDDQPLVDLQVQELVVATTPVTRDLDLKDAAFITGTLSDADTSNPLSWFGVEVMAYPWDGMSVGWTETCEDGSYRLRVEPSVTGYIVGSSRWEENGYVPLTWDGTSSGTFFPCEGSAIAVPTVGSTIPGIDLSLHSGAGAISGSILTQESGCQTTLGGQHWVQVDDGSMPACSLGVFDWNAPDGTYRIYGLPHSGLMPALRVCDYNVFDASPQCYTMKQPPGYTPVSVPAGTEVGSVDFCLGNRPESQVLELKIEKSGSNLMLTWDPSTDPYHDRYRVRGATSLAPSGPGSFPDDPYFEWVFEDYSTSAWIPLDSPHTFFLVTDIGVTGTEGPSGTYGN